MSHPEQNTNSHQGPLSNKGLLPTIMNEGGQAPDGGPDLLPDWIAEGTDGGIVVPEGGTVDDNEQTMNFEDKKTRLEELVRALDIKIERFEKENAAKDEQIAELKKRVADWKRRFKDSSEEGRKVVETIEEMRREPSEN